MQRREILAAGAVVGLPMSAWSAGGFPDKPLKLILSFPPGSTSDVLARYLGEKVARELGQPVVVESKPGAQGAIAARFVAKSAPDGYTLFMGTNSTHAANLYLMKNLGYDPVTDFAPLAQCASNPLLLVVNAGLPVRTLKEFVQYAKERPGQLSYGAGNTGSLIAVHLLKTAANIEAVAVNYPGVAQACNDLVGGRLQFMMVDPTVIRPFVEAGKVRILGISSRERLASMPEVAPLAEQGLERYDYASWAGFFAPAGIPADIKSRLSQVFQKVLQEPETQKYLTNLGMIARHSNAQEFAAFVKSQVQVWERLIKESGVPSV